MVLFFSTRLVLRPEVIPVSNPGLDGVTPLVDPFDPLAKTGTIGRLDPSTIGSRPTDRRLPSQQLWVLQEFQHTCIAQCPLVPLGCFWCFPCPSSTCVGSGAAFGSAFFWVTEDASLTRNNFIGNWCLQDRPLLSKRLQIPAVLFSTRPKVLVGRPGPTSLASSFGHLKSHVCISDEASGSPGPSTSSTRSVHPLLRGRRRWIHRHGESIESSEFRTTRSICLVRPRDGWGVRYTSPQVTGQPLS